MTRLEAIGSKTILDSPGGVGLRWRGPALVDGEVWPAADDESVWLPAGPHTVEPAKTAGAGPRLLYLNAELRAARTVGPKKIEFSYRSASRAIAVFDRFPGSIELDGNAAAGVMAGPATLLLPRGQHLVSITVE